MQTALRPRTFILFAGDLFFFIFALWLSLYLRAFEAPSRELFLQHLAPFSLLFVVWVAVFFIAGLYESRSIILERRALSATLLITQVVNVAIASLFFFYVPIFGIAPKTVLLIYLAVSFLLVLCWRAVLFPTFLQHTEPAIVVGEGNEIGELVEALSRARRAPARIVSVISPGPALAREIADTIRAQHIRIVIADWSDPRVAGIFPGLYNYLSAGVRFFDAIALYEDVFGRIALSRIDDRWIARNVSRYAHTLYDSFKRMMDIIIAGLAGVVSLVLYPFLALAIVIESGFPVFIAQERVGEDNRPMKIYKFRSMTRNEVDLSVGMQDNRVTAVGKFLRATRLDELPQLWSIVRGNLSLIGPRPELPSGVALYEKEIPYYDVRHLIKPGLSGWAQLYQDNHPHHGEAVEATREKLSYDLYYVKHRSLVLDLVIAMKTIKKLLTRSGA
ncbi:MAG: exopolysaccharide biosynthesis polyprenyl glycosylphosphotransferase [Patescibacteria group bacterium]|nr:exopolysaccharide biosynthesis polyprenyl glycosylphosphotransferase [Patescibacteria group bacterium]